MKSNIEHMPEAVFNWMQTYAFNQLDTEQQSTVLNYMDASDYNDMHKATVDTSVIAKKAQPKGQGKVHKELLEVFDEIHKTDDRVIPIWQKPVGLGKVAAVVIVMMAGIGWQFFSNGHNEPEIVEVVRPDTIYVRTEVPVTNVINDTVTVYAQQQTTAKPYPVNFKTTTPVNAENTGIHTIGTDELDKTYNKTRNNSLKHDSLAYKYGFVTL